MRVSIDDSPFNYNGIDISSIKIKNDPIDEITKRPILGIKLLHKATDKNILFINLWAAHDIVSNQNKEVFLEILQNVIIKLGYNTGDRIIISGDFNEFYEQAGDDVNVLLLNNVNLYLKQTQPSCCGNTDITRAFLADEISTSPFDLIYDSNPFNSMAIVSSNRVSDHKPIVYNIEPAPSQNIGE